MKNPKTTKTPSKIKGPFGKAIAALIVILGIFAFWPGGDESGAKGKTFEVRRGKLQITVLEGGSLEALESQEIRSEVKGYQGTKILSIVEEGYQVTEEDLKNGKVLVVLDSSELRDKIVTQDIQFESTQASLIEARNGYDIQVNQNLSDVKASELKMKFARMDVEKFLGKDLTQTIFKRLALKEPERIDVITMPPNDENFGSAVILPVPPVIMGSEDPALNASSVVIENVAGRVFQDSPSVQIAPAPMAEKPNQEPITVEITKEDLPVPVKAVMIDYSEYADESLLGDGEAQQKIREAKDKYMVTQTDLGLAKDKLEGTTRLFGRGFVTQLQLDNDSVQVDKTQVQVDSTRTARDLFMKYEFPKQAEELVSKYEEALLELDKTQKEAISKLAQAQAKLKSAESRYNIQKNQLTDLRDQVEKCTIKAEKLGLVIYGGRRDGVFYYNQEQIREGATIRQRQAILTIPDMTKMGVIVKIHESHIKKVKKGMPAQIRVESEPDKPLAGEVTKVGVLPDSQNRYMNPDLKVYKTEITVTGVHEWTKPGMTAKVEIFVDELEDVVYVPIQAVFAEEKQRVCYISGRNPERRVAETGQYNDEFIEIKTGLKEGEIVLLKEPKGLEGVPSDASESEAGADKQLSNSGLSPQSAPGG